MPATRTSFVKRIIRWRYLIAINVLVIVLLGMSLGREVVRSRSIGARIAQLQTQAEDLAARNIEISKLRTAMQTESFIEREARLKLGMKKPGESVVVIHDDAGTSDETAAKDPSDPLDYVIDDDGNAGTAVANPTRWWYYFFDKDSFNMLANYE